MSWTEGQEEMYDDPPRPDDLTLEQEDKFVRLFRDMIQVIEETDAEREKSQASLTPEEQAGPGLPSEQPLYHTSADLATLQSLPEHDQVGLLSEN